MVFKGIRKKVKKVKASLEKRQAKRKGMTVTEYRQYKKQLASVRQEQQIRHEAWKIEESYRQKRSTAQRTGQTSRLRGILVTMSKNAAANIYGLAPRKKRKKRKKKRKRKKRKKRKNKRRR